MDREIRAALPALSQLSAHIIDDADFVIGDRLPASDNLDGVEVIRPCGFGGPSRAQSRSIHPVDPRQTTRRRQGDDQSIFRKAIDRGHGSGAKSVRAKTSYEPAQSRDAHRLGAVSDETERTVVQPLRSESSIL